MTQEKLTDIKTTLEKIVENWFLSEPLVFAAYCTHVLAVNPKITVPFRSGKMRIEYNPNILENMGFDEIKKGFENEIARILLKHPYSRKPDPVIPLTARWASNVTINQEIAEQCAVPPKLCYEQYYSLLSPEQIIDEKPAGKKKGGKGSCNSCGGEGESGEDNEDLKNLLGQAYNAVYGATGLWEENDIAKEELNELIKDYAARGNKWGSFGGSLKDQILASLTAKIDYRAVLKNFRATILSSKKHLTRFKPSRRFGFEYMGSKRDFTTKLLLAIDTSGSISDKDLQNFYGVINKFFKYGIEAVDVLNFDCKLQGEPVSFKKRQTTFKISGRGGTDFQPVFDYAKDHPKYDGVIIFTDGDAAHPEKKAGTKAKFVWVVRTEYEWNEHHEWMDKTGKSCFLRE